MESNKPILLIGGEGYVGNIVSLYLLSKGYKVISYDNLLYEQNFCVSNKINNKNYQFIYGDILETKKLQEHIRSSSSVVLLAGLVGDPITKKYPAESESVNNKGVKNVIDLCFKSEIQKLIFISTCSNYGLLPDGQIATESTELTPLSLYAKFKVEAEKYILSMNDSSTVKPVILRFATAFGLSPRMRFDLTIGEFTRDLFLKKDLLVYDANTWRPYCHVGDFARLIETVIEAENEKVAFEIFNAGSDLNNATKKMIVDLILKKIPNAEVEYQEHGNDPRNYKVSFQKVKSTLQFEPQFSIQDGVDELLNALSSHVYEHVDKFKNVYGNYELNYREP